MFDAISFVHQDMLNSVQKNTLVLEQAQLGDCIFFVDEKTGKTKVNCSQISEINKKKVDIIIDLKDSAQDNENTIGEISMDFLYSTKIKGYFLGIGESNKTDFSTYNNNLYGTIGTDIGGVNITSKGGTKLNEGFDSTQYSETQVKYSRNLGENNNISLNGKYYFGNGEQGEETLLNLGTNYSGEILSENTSIGGTVIIHKLDEQTETSGIFEGNILYGGVEGKNFPYKTYITGKYDNTNIGGNTISNDYSITTGISGNIKQLGYDVNNTLGLNGNSISLNTTYQWGENNYQGNLSHNFGNGETTLKCSVIKKGTILNWETETSFNNQNGIGIKTSLNFPF